MASSTDEPLRAALGALAAALAQHGAPHMLIGGMAVIFRGVARQTVDIDATVWSEGLDLERFLSTLEHHGIVGRIPDVFEFARRHQVLLLRHVTSGTPIEVTLASLPFEKAALERAEHIQIEDLSLPVALVEDLVIYKTVAWRDRDRSDVERLLLAHGAHIDLERVRRTVAEFAEALGEPERVHEFEQLVRRTRAG